MDPKAIGLRIKEARKSRKVTQEKAAKLSGISRSYYADVENGRYSPSTDTLMKISKALNVSITFLLEGKMTSSDYQSGLYEGEIPGADYLRSFDFQIEADVINFCTTLLDKRDYYDEKDYDTLYNLFVLLDKLKEAAASNIEIEGKVHSFIARLLYEIRKDIEEKDVSSLTNENFKRTLETYN